MKPSDLKKFFGKCGVCTPGVERLEGYATWQEAWDNEPELEPLIVAWRVIGAPRPELMREFCSRLPEPLASEAETVIDSRLFTRLAQWALTVSVEDQKKWLALLRELYKGFDFDSYPVRGFKARQ